MNNPCLNKGECVDEVGDYRCVCEAEYTGKNCQHRVDDCANEPCQNGGTCSDKVNGFECLCRPGFVGKFLNPQITYLNVSMV